MYRALLVGFHEDGFDVVHDERSVEEPSAVDIPDLMLSVEQVHFQNVTEEAAPLTVLVPELCNRLIKVAEDGLQIVLIGVGEKIPMRMRREAFLDFGEASGMVSLDVEGDGEQDDVFRQLRTLFQKLVNLL